MARSVSPELRDCLDNLKAEGARQLSAGELADIIENVVGTLRTDLGVAAGADSAPTGANVEDGGSALAALSSLDSGPDGKPLFGMLKQELDEIREATQNAAATFLVMAEDLENLAERFEDEEQAIMLDTATSIYEGCSFQDISGQRLTRINEIFQEIELRVTQARGLLGDEDAKQRSDELSDSIEETSSRKTEHILHGPQNAGTANTQEEIDKILASFD